MLLLLNVLFAWLLFLHLIIFIRPFNVNSTSSAGVCWSELPDTSSPMYLHTAYRLHSFWPKSFPGFLAGLILLVGVLPSSRTCHYGVCEVLPQSVWDPVRVLVFNHVGPSLCDIALILSVVHGCCGRLLNSFLYGQCLPENFMLFCAGRLVLLLFLLSL